MRHSVTFLIINIFYHNNLMFILNLQVILYTNNQVSISCISAVKSESESLIKVFLKSFNWSRQILRSRQQLFLWILLLKMLHYTRCKTWFFSFSLFNLHNKNQLQENETTSPLAGFKVEQSQPNSSPVMAILDVVFSSSCFYSTVKLRPGHHCWEDTIDIIIVIIPAGDKQLFPSLTSV